ncbi:MAG: hypothetical protein HY868_04905 [Chloroflexi bacterium]|nr:hypothetical protein [Chloroflexota bacterium]
MRVKRGDDRDWIAKCEFTELLKLLNYYMVGGLTLGIAVATVVLYGGIVFFKDVDGLPMSPKFITVAIVLLIGALTGLLAFLILLPAELKLIRRQLKPKILAQRLSRRK